MLQTESLIVILNISQWTARKHDKKITDEVKESHNASEDAGRYNKLLISKVHMEDIAKVSSRARAFHYENTLPWGDNNERLLPTKNYMKYIGEMSVMKSEFDHAVSMFFKNYDAVIDEARVRLNGMFRESDYPSKNEIQDKFAFITTFMPVPTSDIRVSLENDEVDSIRKSVESEIATRLNSAISNIWDRVKDQLVKVKDRMSSENNIFRDSLFENIREITELIPSLNVTNDSNINEVCEKMKSLIYDPEMVRNDANLRKEVLNETDKILDTFTNFFKQ